MITSPIFLFPLRRLCRKKLSALRCHVNLNIVYEKGGECASNPLQLRIFSIGYGEHTMSLEVTFVMCLKTQ